MHAKIAKLGTRGRSCRRRRDDLRSVRRRGDSRSLVDVHADIAPLGKKRLTRMQTHPHAHRPFAQPFLRLEGGSDRVFGAGKRKEEGIALSVHLDAAASSERLSHDPAVLNQRVGVVGAQFTQQPSRSLDVRKHEGDRPDRKIPHQRIMRFTLDGWLVRSGDWRIWPENDRCDDQIGEMTWFDSSGAETERQPLRKRDSPEGSFRNTGPGERPGQEYEAYPRLS